ncbi:MAG: hypothetical protein ABI691_23885 [Ginsengibacter sp.]
MKKLVLISISFLLTLFTSDSGFSQTQKSHYFAPFQGKKVFCSTDHEEKAFVTIKGNAVNVIIGKKKITGTYKSNKILLTNDPGEIEYRKTAGKYHYGTFYVIATDYVSILEPENGEYPYTYELCK